MAKGWKWGSRWCDCARAATSGRIERGSGVAAGSVEGAVVGRGDAALPWHVSMHVQRASPSPWRDGSCARDPSLMVRALAGCWRVSAGETLPWSDP